MSEPARYRFSPLDRRGLLLGLAPSQLATVAAGVVVALLLLRRIPAGAGLVAAVVTVAASVALACWPVAGRPAVRWAPLVGRWVLGGGQRRRLWRPGRVLAPPGIEVLAAPRMAGEDDLGVVRDLRSGSWSAVLPVGCGSFTLLDTEEKQRRLGAWGAILAGAARAGSPVHRLQWIERTRAGDSDALERYFEDHAVGDDIAAPGRDMRRSYREIIDGAGRASQVHEVLLVVSIHPRRAARQLRSFGRGPEAACALLRREVRLLQGQLRTAEARPGPPLTLGHLAGAVRSGFDPARPDHGLDPRTAWPMAIEEGWSSVRVDGRWHATYWVAEWPRLDVGPDFLTPLLLVGGVRCVSLTMAPVPPAQAIREVQSARTADLADAELRRRAGFLSTARQRRASDGALHREAELADGHGDYRFSGYVSVSASTPEELEGACAGLEQAAQQSHLEVRLLHGQQCDAFSWTLPLGRGLA